MQERQQIVRNGKASLHVTVRGRGSPIVFIPFLGRGADDFDDFSRRLVTARSQAILPATMREWRTQLGACERPDRLEYVSRRA